MKVTLIYNPSAGVDQDPSGDEVLEVIRRAGHDATSLSTHGHNWEHGLLAPTDLVAVAGGDGTVGRIGKLLVGTSVPVAILPMGTANNIAKTFGLLDHSIEDLIDAWPGAARVKFDVGVAKGPWGSKYFIEGLGVGLFTGTMSRLDASGNIEIAHLDDAQEKLVSVMEILKKRLPTYPAKTLKVSADGVNLSGEYILLEIMNTRYVGPNLYLAPTADACDGLLDLVAVTHADQEKFAAYLTECIDGKTNPPALWIRKTRELKLDWDGFAVHIDDEVWPDKIPQFPLPSKVIEVGIKRAAVQFLAFK